MEYISSSFMRGHQNPPVRKSDITRIEPVSASLTNSNLSALYFYGRDEQGKEKLIRAWFYNSRASLWKDLNHVRENLPHIAAEKV